MTKVDSRKLHDGPLKPSRGSWWNTLQLPVIQPCRTEWPKWPPGATATVKWTECLTVNTPVLSSVSRSLARSLSLLLPLQPPNELYKEMSPQLTIEALISFQWGYFVQRITLWHLLYVSVQTNLLLLSSLPRSPAGTVLLSFLFCPSSALLL